eukprot:2152897-Alexandrium_andersonii.AAC.1
MSAEQFARNLPPAETLVQVICMAPQVGLLRRIEARGSAAYARAVFAALGREESSGKPYPV